MAVLVEVSHVEARLMRTLTGPELGAAQALVDEVSALARGAVAGIDDLVDADPDHAVVVAGRLAAAVKRVMSNPDGYSRVQIDDATFQRSAAGAAGELYLSEQDVRVLSGGSATGAIVSPGPYVVGLSG